MSKSAIFLYTEPGNPLAPLWMLHLSSLTLAELRLREDGAPHEIHVDSENPPPDAAVEGFVEVLNAMDPDFADNYVMVTRPHPLSELPERMFMQPADGGRGFLTYTRETRGDANILGNPALAIGGREGAHRIGPIWSAKPAPALRESAIRNAAEWTKRQFGQPLEIFEQTTYFPGLWLERPDTVARLARPSPLS